MNTRYKNPIKKIISDKKLGQGLKCIGFKKLKEIIKKMENIKK